MTSKQKGLLATTIGLIGLIVGISVYISRSLDHIKNEVPD